MKTGTLPISVPILTWNSARTLRAALESVRACQEIILIDGGSTDDTLTIAKEFGATIVRQPQQGPIRDFATVRNVGLQATTQPWVLVLDSDEIISAPLMDEITHIVASQNVPAAYYVPRKYLLPDGRMVDHASTYPNKRIYFFHRDAVTEWIKPVHERVKLKEGIAVEDLHHPSLAPLGTIEDYKRKNLRYLAIESAASQQRSWVHWLRHRVLHTVRSRCIAAVRLAWIWLWPRKGARLPLRHELVRFWYAWELIKRTCPLAAKR